MASVKALTDFSKLRDDHLKIRAQNIVGCMTDNTNYPAPVPALAEVTAAITAYRDALAEAKIGGKDKTAIKHQKRQVLEGLLQALAWYVQANCRNDLPILLSSGFDSRKPKAPVGVLGKPANLKVENGSNPGEIKLSVNKVKHAGSYVFEYAATPVNSTTQWTTRVGTARTITIEGLTSRRQYAFRVAGVGADPSLVYSEVISRYVQ